MKKNHSLPSLHLSEWKQTKETVHLYAQIVGKIRMSLTPPQNHWWHVPLYVTSRGLGTHSIPCENYRFEIDFDFIDHQLIVTTSLGSRKYFDLHDGLSVSEFYHSLMEILDDFGIKVQIRAEPYENRSKVPFAEDQENSSYDKTYVERFWTILSWTDRVFKKFNSSFYGKVCPVQLYWHSFDLAVTRFSGDKAPEMTEGSRVNREAYSHEVISFGFWAGDENIQDAAFYSYTHPSPVDLDTAPLSPPKAHWITQNGSPMALLMYEDLRNSSNPEKALIDFLESAYRAGSEKANWNASVVKKDLLV